MSTIHIRAREPEDAAALARIMNLPGVVAGTLQLPYRSIQSRREQIAQTNPGSYHLVAEVDGRVVGALSLMVEQSPRRSHVGSIGMMVHDDFQGQGVGSALMEAIIELAERWLGLERIELTVYTDNAAAIHLYEKFGFAVEGTSPKYAWRDGRYVSAHHMARLRE